MENKDLFMLSAEYNDYDNYDDIFEDYDEENSPNRIVYVPYTTINIQDMGLGTEIPVNNADFIYLDKPTVKVSDNKTINTQRTNIKQTIQKQPQERIDYINKKRTDLKPINNISQKKKK